MTTTEAEEVDLAIEADGEADAGATGEHDSAAEAFGRLEREMALMRRAVEHLAAERADIAIPDYNPTLVKMAANLASLDKSLKAMEQVPALQITPEHLGERIERIAQSASSEYQATIRQWRTAASGLERGLSDALGSALKHEAQIRRERQFFGVGASVAALLMTFLPGIVARELPSNWQLPERMARRIVDQPTILDAGIHLIRKADPGTWEAIVDAAALNSGNRAAIKRCKAAAAKAKRPVDCQVRVDQ